MRVVPFVKLHGCANDYLLVDGFAERLPDWGSFARATADRRTAVGSDGLLVALPPTRAGADARMAMFNPDGSEAEMCGNGLRCLGKFLFDRGRVGRDFRIETRGGVVPMRVERVADGAAPGRGSVALDLSAEIGVPDFERQHVPMAGPPGPVLDEPFLVDGRALRVTALRLGNPHCVIFVDDVETVPVATLGPAIERDARFPQRVNVEFVQVVGRDLLLQRTWERGAGETLACGSGATAAAIAAREVRGFGPDVRVRLRGGELAVEWPGRGAPARLRGPAAEVFAGTIALDGS